MVVLHNDWKVLTEGCSLPEQEGEGYPATFEGLPNECFPLFLTQTKFLEVISPLSCQGSSNQQELYQDGNYYSGSDPWFRKSGR